MAKDSVNIFQKQFLTTNILFRLYWIYSSRDAHGAGRKIIKKLEAGPNKQLLEGHWPEKVGVCVIFIFEIRSSEYSRFGNNFIQHNVKIFAFSVVTQLRIYTWISSKELLLLNNVIKLNKKYN